MNRINQESQIGKCYRSIVEKRPFGKTGYQVSAIGQGTWMLEANAKNAIDSLRAGVDQGLSHIDTAEMYGDGRVEEIVGKALQGIRQSAFLVSKVLPTNASYEGTISACERSLRRLSTDYLDGYLLHRPSAHPLEETIKAFTKLKESGKILSFGVSNFDLQDLTKAVSLAAPHNIACNQVLYHIKERAVEYELLPFCQKNGIALVAYTPFGRENFPRPSSKEGFVLQRIAKELGATPRQVALKFLLRNNTCFVIPKATSINHLMENARIPSSTFSGEQIEELDQIFPLGEERNLPVL